VSDAIELRLLNDQIADLRALLRVALSPDADALQRIRSVRLLLLAEIDVMRKEMVPKTATESVPDYCQGVDPSACGRQDDDARVEMRSFASPHKWRCRGCRREFDGFVTT
jgi:hypothetical protein